MNTYIYTDTIWWFIQLIKMVTTTTLPQIHLEVCARVEGTHHDLEVASRNVRARVVKCCETDDHLGMDQYLLITFLGEWTSIYQLFWCSPGVQGFDTLPFDVLKSPWLINRYRESRERAARFRHWFSSVLDGPLNVKPRSRGFIQQRYGLKFHIEAMFNSGESLSLSTRTAHCVELWRWKPTVMAIY